MDHKDEHTGNPEREEVEEEEDEEAKRAVVLGPQVPLKEQLELDKVTAQRRSISDLLVICSFPSIHSGKQTLMPIQMELKFGIDPFM